MSPIHGVKRNVNLKSVDNVVINTSAGRSHGFSLSMFALDIRDQTSNISDYGVESINQTEKSNIK